MATGVLGTDVEAFESNFYSGAMERIAQNIAVLNQTNGAIRLIDQRLKGNFSRNLVKRRVANPISRRTSTDLTAKTDIAAQATSDTSVKVRSKYGPVANTKEAWYEMLADAGGSVEQLALEYGRDAMDEVLRDMLDTGLSAASAALANQADNLIALGAALDTGGMIDGFAKFGDAAISDITAVVMSSASWFALVKDQVVTLQTTGISDIGLATGVPQVFNKTVLVTDSVSLGAAPDSGGAGAATKNILFLTDDALRLTYSMPMDPTIDTVTGLGNTVIRIEGDYAFNVGLRGFQWDETTGGSEPSDAAIATGTNWAKVGTSRKHLAGIVLTHT